MKNKIFLALAFAVVSFSAFAVTTANSFHFQAIPNNSSLTCNATTSASYVQISSTHGASQPDIAIRNVGSTAVYFEVGSGGASSSVATVPTNSSYGSQVINPGESDLLSKYSADTVSCITSASTGTLVITPGTGN